MSHVYRPPRKFIIDNITFCQIAEVRMETRSLSSICSKDGLSVAGPFAGSQKGLAHWGYTVPGER